MNVAKYFKLRQKLLLRSVDTDDALQSAETISAAVIACSDDILEVTLGYPLARGQKEQGAFLSGQTLLIMSEYFGLGVKLTGRVSGVVENGVVRLAPADDLELFSRRTYPRSNVLARFCSARCKGSLDSCRKQWRLARDRGRPGGRIESLPVNISAGGVCVPLSPPVINGELYLLFLELNNCQIAAWALAEVVWSKSMENGQQSTGLRFVEISVQNQTDINNFVMEELKRQGCEIDWSLKKSGSLQLLEY